RSGVEEQRRARTRPLDYRGVPRYAPLGHRDEQTNRSRSGNARPAAAQTARAGAAARLGDQSPSSRAVGRRAERQRGIAVPGAAQARTGRLDQSRVEDDGEQPQGEVLRADAARQETTRGGGGELETAVLRHLARRSIVGNLTGTRPARSRRVRHEASTSAL